MNSGKVFLAFNTVSMKSIKQLGNIYYKESILSFAVEASSSALFSNSNWNAAGKPYSPAT